MTEAGEIISFREVEEKVLSLRGQGVILDRDVAELYGVETKRVNEAVGNNPDKFPEGYVVTLSNQEKKELVENFDRFDKLKHSTAAPSAFTEKGLYMLATILKSPKAAQTTIAIVETFAKIRELSRAVSQLSETKEKPRQKALMQKSGEILADILDDGTLEVTGDETTIEINFAIMKIRHSVKRGKKGRA
ncbi:MAG: ORF6N domain-containing protein [Synergistaceae bacterium]|nr:ORF6N domain-containing protein [Synergistaceae bacterium]